MLPQATPLFTRTPWLNTRYAGVDKEVDEEEVDEQEVDEEVCEEVCESGEEEDWTKVSGEKPKQVEVR